MTKALIVIDYTNDFIAENGALSCGEPGRAIESYIALTIDEFISRGDRVVFAVDTHRLNDQRHPESRLFPPHNIGGTPGRDLFGFVGGAYVKHIDNKNVKWIDKTRYSAFAGTDLDLWLRNEAVSEVHLVGVCTDICVLHTAVDAYNLSYSIVVHKDGVASFDPVGHDWALSHFKNVLGAAVI